MVRSRSINHSNALFQTRLKSIIASFNSHRLRLLVSIHFHSFSYFQPFSSRHDSISANQSSVVSIRLFNRSINASFSPNMSICSGASEDSESCTARRALDELCLTAHSQSLDVIDSSYKQADKISAARNPRFLRAVMSNGTASSL